MKHTATPLTRNFFERPLCIVHVMTSVMAGGAEENTFATCRGQIERGYDVWLIHGQSLDAATLANAPTGLHIIQEPRLRRDIQLNDDMRAVIGLARTLRRLGPDVVHTHQSKGGVIGRLAAWMARVPVIVHGVHILPFVNVGPVRARLFLALERLVAPITDAYVAVARGMHDANVAAGLGTAETNHIVYSGMALEAFREATPHPDAPDGPMIAMVAAMEPRKRHAAFLTVFADLARTRPSLQLCLLGQGQEETAVRAQVEALGLADNVHFLGFRDDVARWIAAADLCVLPSIREGLPRVVVQYVAAGKPVVVTHLDGIEEIVEDGVTGFVVGQDDFGGMGRAIERLLDDRDLAARMAAAARARDLSQWSVERMEPAVDGILQPLVAQNITPLPRHPVLHASSTGWPEKSRGTWTLHHS